MIADYEIKEMARQLFDAITLLKKARSKLKNEDYARRHDLKGNR